MIKKMFKDVLFLLWIFYSIFMLFSFGLGFSEGYSEGACDPERLISRYSAFEAGCLLTRKRGGK